MKMVLHKFNDGCQWRVRGNFTCDRLSKFDDRSIKRTVECIGKQWLCVMRVIWSNFISLPLFNDSPPSSSR